MTERDMARCPGLPLHGGATWDHLIEEAARRGERCAKARITGGEMRGKVEKAIARVQA